MTSAAHKSLERLRKQIAARTRELRIKRGLTQSLLAAELVMSQSRLSEVELGGGSFTAEQFVLLLRFFNVTTQDFLGESRDPDAELQNALARLGASHLREVDILPSERLDRVQRAVREALIVATPRLLAALAPVLVHRADDLNFAEIYASLEALGLGRRLGWVVENTAVALDELHKRTSARVWTQEFRRAELLLHRFRVFAEDALDEKRLVSAPLDVLDPTIRSEQTVQEVWKKASKISRRWRVVSSLGPQDFLEALEAAGAND